MSRHQHTHPGWCDEGHACNGLDPGGQHRSQPVSFDTPSGRIVATRVRTYEGANRVEIRAVVDLPARDDRTEHAARLLIFWVQRAIAQSRAMGGRR